MRDYLTNLNELKKQVNETDTIVIGAGSGLSTAAGYAYSGERFERYFGDFIEKYHFTDMYTGSFYPFPSLEEYWAWWSRQIYYNSYVDPPKDVYQKLLKLVEKKEYFVITTNVDHAFQRAGFDKNRLFYTQGDYGLLQCSEPCHEATYDNEELVRKMMKEQKGMKIPSELIPYCPRCKKPMKMNLRADQSFAQDQGWYEAKNRYEAFVQKHGEEKILFLELGVGHNTPVWIKYPFWKLTEKKMKAFYVCINQEEAYMPPQIKERSLLLNEEIGKVLDDLDVEIK